MLAEVDANDALRRVLEAFESLGYPRSVVEQWSIPAADAADLVAALRATSPAPRRILEVGTFVGTSALLMLLALPESEVHTVDPNLPLEVEFAAMRCEPGGADLARTTQEIAALAAERLGVRSRLHLHAGGFATDATFAGRAAPVAAIGAALIDAHGPFDAAFIDGLHFEQAVVADLTLAARGVRDDGAMVLHDAIGYWGAPVRRAISRFLEEEPRFSLAHPPYSDLYRSIAVLSRRAWLEQTMFAARAHAAHGAEAARLPELLHRAAATQLPPMRAVARDEASVPLAGLFACGSGPVIAIALDTLDAVPHDALDAAIARCAADCDAMLLGLTPPGERDAASIHSRPLATTVSALDRAGFDAFDAIAPFLEPFAYPLGAGCVLPTSTTFLSTSLIAVRRGTAAHAHALAGGLDPLDRAAARSIESSRTQRAHDRASLARFRSEHAQLNARLAEMESRNASSAKDRHAALVAEIESLRARLQHMLDWRIHIGRHAFWRRPGARV